MCKSLIENSAEEVIALEHNHCSFSSFSLRVIDAQLPGYIGIQLPTVTFELYCLILQFGLK